MRREEMVGFLQSEESEKLFMVVAGVGYAAKSRGGRRRDCIDLYEKI